MKEVKISYKGKTYVFEFYGTTISGANIFFVKAKDKEVVKWLIEDHFFIVASPEPGQEYLLNAIKNTKEEAELKGIIANAILAEFYAEGFFQNLGKHN